MKELLDAFVVLQLRAVELGRVVEHTARIRTDTGFTSCWKPFFSLTCPLKTLENYEVVSAYFSLSN